MRRPNSSGNRKVTHSPITCLHGTATGLGGKRFLEQIVRGNFDENTAFVLAKKWSESNNSTLPSPL